LNCPVPTGQEYQSGNKPDGNKRQLNLKWQKKGFGTLNGKPGTSEWQNGMNRPDLKET
jgi:hypothetical protein